MARRGLAKRLDRILARTFQGSGPFILKLLILPVMVNTALTVL